MEAPAAWSLGLKRNVAIQLAQGGDIMRRPLNPPGLASGFGCGQARFWLTLMMTTSMQVATSLGWRTACARTSSMSAWSLRPMHPRCGRFERSRRKSTRGLWSTCRRSPGGPSCSSAQSWRGVSAGSPRWPLPFESGPGLSDGVQARGNLSELRHLLDLSACSPGIASALRPR